MISASSPCVFRSSRHGLLAWKAALVAILLSLTSVVLAQEVEPDPETRTAARELARQGADAFEQQDYETALDRFDRAGSLVRAPTLCIMQARTLVKLERLVEALDKYEETQRMPVEADAPEALHQAVADARTEGDELRPRIPQLTIHIKADREVASEVRVLLDGKPVPDALLDVPVPADPGTHEVTGEVEGMTRVTRQVVLSEGERTEIEIPLRRAVFATTTAPPPPPPGPIAEKAVGLDRAASDPSVRLWGWAAVGLGGTALAVSTITGIVALDRKSHLDSVCQPGCPPDAAGDIDSFRTNRTASYVAAALGTMSLGVGGYLILSSGEKGSQILAEVGPTGARLTGSF